MRAGIARPVIMILHRFWRMKAGCKKLIGILVTASARVAGSCTEGLETADLAVPRLWQMLYHNSLMTHTPQASPVFLSYSRKDKQWADDIASALKSRGIQCWVDRHSLQAGDNFRESIILGISAAKVMVVILSDHANESKYVEIEVGHALSGELVIIPCRIQDSPLKGGLKFSLAGVQSLDVFHPPKEEKIRQLVDTIESVLGRSGTLTSNPKPRRSSGWQSFKRLALQGCMLLVAVYAAMLALQHHGGTGQPIADKPYAESKPASDTKPTIENMGVTYEIKDWGWEGDKLVFCIVATNHNADTRIIQFVRCGVWDDTDNNTERYNLIMKGQLYDAPMYLPLELPSEVRTTFGLHFYGVSRKSKTVRLLQIGLSSLPAVTFHDIPIEGRQVSNH